MKGLLSGLKEMLARKKLLSRDEIAELLNVSQEAYEAFEKAYRVHAFDTGPMVSDRPFDVSVRDLAASRDGAPEPDDDTRARLDRIVQQTVEELDAQTAVMRFVDGDMVEERPALPDGGGRERLTPEDIEDIPLDLRPQVLGDYMSIHCGESTPSVLFMYREYLRAQSSRTRMMFYGKFRQGLDILDLDPILYEMLKMNPNSMSKWLPAVAKANSRGRAFRIPDTTIAAVPITLLQLSRMDYGWLNDTTLRIVDEYARRVFGLDDRKEYFVKTGTFSSKFDFRNARVGGDEVKDLGEYLMFLSNTAVLMAGPLSTPCIYGASTTNEWVVREYVPDVEDDPCIYKGLPLRTEYRVFVDADDREVLGMSPYWEPEMLKERFSTGRDASSPHSIHDYIIIQKHQGVMMERYERNKDRVREGIAAMLQYLDLRGQWSIDIMQNGDDLWLIDMGLAANSALRECVPPGKLKAPDEEWIPALPLTKGA